MNSLNVIQQPEELGKVKWIRNLQQGQELAKAQKKSLFILFQEVPGCSTCKNYGNKVLSHPLIVEAIETYFIPVCIYNNAGGDDKKTLTYYNEPTWNNPVIRIEPNTLDKTGKRISGDYSAAGLAQHIIQEIKKQDKEIPQYLLLLSEELWAQQQGIQETTVSMYCFWSGEKTYGTLKGVVHTEAGFMHGEEVVKIKYNPNLISLEQIVSQGRQQKCLSQAFASTEQLKIELKKAGVEHITSEGQFRKDKESKYYLQHSEYKYIPMLPIQATRANAMLGTGLDPKTLFSPRQLQTMQSQKQKNMIGENMQLVWKW